MYYNFKNILSKYGLENKLNYSNIYIHLYEALKKAIIDRSLKEGLKLPPSRVLAIDLEISRSTVMKAYELLLLEKYIKSVQGSGYYVSSVKHKKTHISFSSKINNSKYPKISRRAKSFIKNTHIKEENDRGIAFRPGLPPLDVFPVHLWKNLSNNYWKTVKGSQLSYSNSFGLYSLRQSISDYLKIYRNINCEPDQIIISTGSLHSLSLISDALINKKDEVVLENPTYPRAFFLFKSLGAKVVSVNIDDEGICINNVISKNPKFVYVTPSNQYPSGIKMTLKRRLELIKWASDNNTLIIEDDYDHEFSNWENPVSSIISLDKEDRTVYLGTFNKLLHPSIRVGYMIVPMFLKDSIKALYQQSSRFVSPATQTILSYFIEKDYLNRHLRKVIGISIERKEYFIEQFESMFQDDIIINSNNTGLHFIGALDPKIDDVKISNYLRGKGIITHPFSEYFIKGQEKKGLVMGYGSVNKKVIKETIFKLRQEYLNYIN